MKLNHILIFATALLVAFGCQKEADKDARAVAAGEEVLTFEAVNAPAQELPVYADGNWAVDVDSDWISVEPTSGTGMGKVTVSVSDNLKDGVQNVPRQGKIIIQGGNTERRGSVIVKQMGDTYHGVATKTLAQIRDLDDEAVAKIASAQVAALTTEGFLLSDDSGFLYVLGKKDVKIGDNVSLNGKKVTFHSNPAFEADELSVTAAGEYNYPAAADLTAAISSYDGKSIVYGKLSGSLINGNMKLGGATIVILNPVAALEIEKVDLHKVELRGFVIGAEKTTGYFIATAVEDKGEDESLVPYPLKWAIGKDGMNYSSSTFTKDTPRIDPIQGVGYIEYVPYDLEHTDGQNNYNLDVQANNPRVTGPWVNDYWLFYGNGAIKAGSEVQIAFEMRSSKWGMKYWLLEYLDGEEWLAAGEPNTATINGEEVPYTVATDENNTNQPVLQVIKFRKNNEHLQIRLRCTVLWRGGGGTTDSRSTASSRLTITNPDDPTYQPSIVILKEGNGIERDPVEANIEVSAELLTFNGTPDEPKTLTITSDHDFSISSGADWLSFDKTEGLAGEATEIQVTCAPSELSELRQSTIKIVSEDSQKIVNVVQSAAGQQLDPFISVSSGPVVKLAIGGGEANVRIQSNVEVSHECAADWVTIEKLDTKAMVEWTNYKVTCPKNETGDERSAVIRFFNKAANQEVSVTVTQSGPQASFPVIWSFPDPATNTNWKDGVDWHCENPTGSYVYSDTHEGKMSVVRFGDAPSSSPTYKNDTPLGTRLLHYGMYKDDYWLFEVYDVKNPAGTYTIGYGSVASAAGPKFFALEYSLDGGSTWTGINTQTKSEALKTGEGAREVTYTYALSPGNTANEVCTVTESFHLGAITVKTKLMIRARVADTMKLDRSAEMTSAYHGGTNRIGARAEIRFAAD